MAKHAVVVAGGGPTGMMLAAELALATVDVEKTSNGVPITCSSAHGPAVFTPARSRCWTSVGLLIGSSRRVRWLRWR